MSSVTPKIKYKYKQTMLTLISIPISLVWKEYKPIAAPTEAALRPQRQIGPAFGNFLS